MSEKKNKLLEYDKCFFKIIKFIFQIHPFHVVEGKWLNTTVDLFHEIPAGLLRSPKGPLRVFNKTDLFSNRHQIDSFSYNY